MKLYAGSSLPNLSKKISQEGPVSLAKMDLSQFPNDELKVLIKENSKEAIILQSFSRPVNSHIIEFALIADALKRVGAEKITAIIPWYGYSKQDRVFTPGEPLSAKVVAGIIDSTPVERVLTVDLHNPSITGYLNIPVENITALPLFVDWAKEKFDPSDTIVVSPDAGSVKSSTTFAKKLNIPIAYANKIRDLKTGEVVYKDIDKDISGKNVLVLDDMIATGGTLLKLAEFLKKADPSSFTVCATHHLFLDGVQEKLEESNISQVVVTDTIEPMDQKQYAKLETISISELLINYLHNSSFA